MFGFLAPIPLIWLVFRGGFRYGFWAGVGFWAVHLIWLPFSFTILFHTFWGAVIFIPLIVIKALMWAAVFGLSKNRPLARVGLWVVMEYLTSLGDVAFPWGLLGYGLVAAPGRVLASLGGVYLLSLVVLGVAYLGYVCWKRLEANPQIFSAQGLGLVGVMVFWLGLWAVPLPPVQPGDTTALLVQGNINPLTRDWNLAPIVYEQLSRQGLKQSPQAQVVVWPESAVLQFPPSLRPVLEGRELISGTFIYQNDSGSEYNSAVRMQNGQVLESYSKHRLVPFGENFPFQAQLPGLYSFFFRAFGFQGDLRSQKPGTNNSVLGRYGTYICYESVFPSVSRSLVQSGAGVLTLVSNDAWYGPSFGGLQHFQMGRLRGVETGRWLLRAGNDGVTAILDPLGRIVQRIPQHQAGFLSGQFSFLKSQTAYVRYGDWAVVLAGLLVLTGLLFRSRPSIV